jgi:hypothetical protein
LATLRVHPATLIQAAPRRVAAALCAGAIAITLNEMVLQSADLIHLQTAHGGLLKLLVQLTGLPVPHSDVFSIAFHMLVGLAMAVAYGLLLEPLWRGSLWMLGLTYAAVTWIANAFLVLPLIGEGIAGAAMVGTGGILWFAAAHTVFFLALSLLYPKMGISVR